MKTAKYHKYTEWEDYKNGMYSSDFMSAPEYYELLDKSKELLKDESKFLEIGIKVIDSWVIASEENLTKSSVNRKAWIGQASCSFNHNATEKITKDAWSELTEEEMHKANSVAQKIINYYERKNNKIHNGLGVKMLF